MSPPPSPVAELLTFNAAPNPYLFASMARKAKAATTTAARKAKPRGGQSTTPGRINYVASTTPGRITDYVANYQSAIYTSLKQHLDLLGVDLTDAERRAIFHPLLDNEYKARDALMRAHPELTLDDTRQIHDRVRDLLFDHRFTD
jgi:hypothetical protein